MRLGLMLPEDGSSPAFLVDMGGSFPFLARCLRVARGAPRHSQ